jgi:hypothetical protein
MAQSVECWPLDRLILICKVKPNYPPKNVSPAAGFHPRPPYFPGSTPSRRKSFFVTTLGRLWTFMCSGQLSLSSSYGVDKLVPASKCNSVKLYSAFWELRQKKDLSGKNEVLRQANNSLCAQASVSAKTRLSQSMIDSKHWLKLNSKFKLTLVKCLFAV